MTVGTVFPNCFFRATYFRADLPNLQYRYSEVKQVVLIGSPNASTIGVFLGQLSKASVGFYKGCISVVCWLRKGSVRAYPSVLVGFYQAFHTSLGSRALLKGFDC